MLFQKMYSLLGKFEHTRRTYPAHLIVFHAKLRMHLEFIDVHNQSKLKSSFSMNFSQVQEFIEVQDKSNIEEEELYLKMKEIPRLTELDKGGISLQD